MTTDSEHSKVVRRPKRRRKSLEQRQRVRLANRPARRMVSGHRTEKREGRGRAKRRGKNNAAVPVSGSHVKHPESKSHLAKHDMQTECIGAPGDEGELVGGPGASRGSARKREPAHAGFSALNAGISGPRVIARSSQQRAPGILVQPAVPMRKKLRGGRAERSYGSIPAAKLVDGAVRVIFSGPKERSLYELARTQVQDTFTARIRTTTSDSHVEVISMSAGAPGGIDEIGGNDLEAGPVVDRGATIGFDSTGRRSDAGDTEMDANAVSPGAPDGIDEIVGDDL